MKPTQLKAFLGHAIQHRQSVLIKARPGVGKSDIVEQTCKDAGVHLIISHPVVSDPTDYKGLPYASNGQANFLPYGELHKIMIATEPTVFFLDDLGQAPPAVQAACMQLLLARQINGHAVSDHVTFIAATNRKEDKAAVSGLLEPVKSRFKSIVELDVNHEDWVRWALTIGNMPTELISFIRFKPKILEEFHPTKDIVNTVSPRTVAAVGQWQNSGLDKSLYFEVFKGAAGEGFANEYTAFLNILKDLPNIDQILMNPDSVQVPKEPSVLCAVGGALASRVNDINATNVFSYIKRLPQEHAMACVKDMTIRKPEILQTRAYISFAADTGNIVLN
jgi:hypothetical protein